MCDLNLGYEGSKKRRIVNQAECEQDLKEFLNSLFSSVHDGISKFRYIVNMFDPNAKVRGDNAMLLNKCIVESIQKNFEEKWIYGKYGRFILRLNGYILLFKKLNGKNKPMHTSTKLVNQILCQQQTSLFNSDAFIEVNEPVLFVGYNMDQFSVITDVKIVYIDENKVKWIISENEMDVTSSNNHIDLRDIKNSEVRVRKSKKDSDKKAE